MPNSRATPWRLNPASTQRLRYLPGELIIEMEADERSTKESLADLKANAGLSRITPLFRSPRKPAGPLDFSLSAGHTAMDRFHVCHLDAKRITPGLLKKLRAHPAYSVVEQMPARFIATTPVPAPAAADPELNHQWGLRAIRWFKVERPAARQVTVAVLDSGVDRTHPDLKNAIVDYHRRTFQATDILGHGTHVSGLIAATVNNAIGIAGVANCRVEVWKVFPDQAQPDGEFYADGPAYLQALRDVLAAAPRGVRVLNLSITGAEASATEQVLFKALAAAGVIVVAAMGNDFENGNPPYYPAAYESVLAVGAVDASLKRWHSSGTGPHIGLVAPGDAILSTVPRRKSAYRSETNYASWPGTSMAVPHVSGAAALYLARHPAATAEETKQAILRSTRRPAALGKQPFTEDRGTGLLDLPGLLA